ncbi:MAG: hypothetical protein WD397_04825 [Wenzhouxiangellaceae bacterium]
MQILPFLPFNCQPFNCQARFRRPNRDKRGITNRGISDIACELAGLTGLLGWLAALFYLTALCAASTVP